jgi:hypothetical protein
MKQYAVDCAKKGLEKFEDLTVCQYIEVMCSVGLLVGWLSTCYIDFFRRLQVM